MPLILIEHDITSLKVDAIVNAANKSLLGGGGVDGAIHRAAGPQLLAECITLNGCATGEAKITRGYALDAKYVIHTVGPIWLGGQHHEEELLKLCYLNSLRLATLYQLESIAFPLISSGVYRYPKQQALEIAISTIEHYLQDHDLTVYLSFIDRKSVCIEPKIREDVEAFIKDAHEFYLSPLLRLDTESPQSSESQIKPATDPIKPQIDKSKRDVNFANPHEYQASYSVRPCYSNDYISSNKNEPKACVNAEIDFYLDQIDESFSQMLFRKIKELQLKDTQCYKRANLDRRLFSKIRSDVNYKPSKPTAVACAIALQLDLKETQELLLKAGFALSNSNKFDLIIKYVISHQIYNVHQINEILFSFDQVLLGS